MSKKRKIVKSCNVLPEELHDEIISFMAALSLGNLSQTSKYFQEKIKKNQHVWIKHYEQKIKKKIILPKNVSFLNICFQDFYIKRFYTMKKVLKKANNYPGDPDENLVDYDETWNLLHFLELLPIIEMRYSVIFAIFIEKMRLRMKYLIHLKDCTEVPSKKKWDLEKMKKNVKVGNQIVKSNILLENATLIKFTMINEPKRVNFLASFTLHSLDESKTLDLEVFSVTKGFISDNEGYINVDRVMCVRIINSKLENKSRFAPNFNMNPDFYSYTIEDEYKGRDDDIYLNVQQDLENNSDLSMIQKVLDYLELDSKADLTMIFDFFHPSIDLY